MKVKISITILILVIIITLVSVLHFSEGNHSIAIPHEDLSIKTAKAITPYSYYKIHLLISENEILEPNTFYYNFLETPSDTFWDNPIQLDNGMSLSNSVFEKYNLLAFAKLSDYSFDLDSYKFSEDSKLEITLAENAIYEKYSPNLSYAFGGIILIPKEHFIEDLDFYTLKRTEEDDYIVHHLSSNSLSDESNSFSEKLIDQSLIQSCNFEQYEDFYIKLITNSSDLTNTVSKLSLIEEPYTISYINNYELFFSYRNILLIAQNSNGTFDCSPEIEKDDEFQDVWPTQNFKIDITSYHSNQEDYLVYYYFIALPKSVSLENISFSRKTRVFENFDNNPVKLHCDDAKEIAKNYLNIPVSDIMSSSFYIIDLNKIIRSNLESTPHYRRMWLFRSKYLDEIFVDATTGEIIEFDRQSF